MNISDLNNKIYGYKELKDGDYANYIMNSIEQQIPNLNLNNINQNYINNKYKEIKF